MSQPQNPLSDLKGKSVYGRDGEKVGKITDFYFDAVSGEPEWFKVGTGLFGGKHFAVPVRGYSVADDGVYVPFSSSRIGDAPDSDGDGFAKHESELYAHYGVTRDDRTQPQSVRAGNAASPEPLASQSGDYSVGLRSVDSGTVRLRKSVDTQPISQDVKVKRETARIEREELNEPVTDAEIGEREIELTFRHEEAFFEKQVMARERVTLSKSIEEGTQRLEGTAQIPAGVMEVASPGSSEEAHRAGNS